MKIFLMLLFLSFLPSLFQPCYSTTIIVDGVSEWKNPTVHIGDSIIFQHKYHYNLFIFKNQRAFNLCNFTHATLLNKPNSSIYMWHPSRPGTFFFSFSNGSKSSCNGSQKLAIQVSAPSPPPPQSFHLSPKLPPMPAPGPISGGVVSSSPAYPWPFHPRQAAPPPSMPPSASSPLRVPSLLPNKGGALPFINSNPAVPLPTGEVDSATIRPLPTSDQGKQRVLMMGFLAVQLALISGLFLLL